MNQYSERLKILSAEYDKMLGLSSTLSTYADLIVEKKENHYAIEYCTVLSKSIEKQPENLRIQARKLKETLLLYLGFEKLYCIFHPETTESKELQEDEKTLTQLQEELNSLIGLECVKSQVKDLIAYYKIRKIREDIGLHSEKLTMHLAFTGNPGTGKTTVARIVGKIYKLLGLLSKGHFLEVSRTDLIAGYQGQTALKVRNVIEKAKGGVLFIDEAYSITENENSDAYGKECLTELTKALEDYRNDLVVIVAGYTEPMENFFHSNPGLKSRFNTFIEFPNYNPSELLSIFNLQCKKNSYKTSESLNSKVKDIIEQTISKHKALYGNGRDIRNMFDKIVMNHARRVSLIENPTIKDLTYLTEEDMGF